MKFAYHTYAFGGRGWLPAWTLEEAVRLSAEIGFSGLELAACRPHGWPSDLNDKRRKEIRDLAASSGLAISGICFNQVNHNIASPLAEERAGALSYGIECIHLAEELNCRRINIGAGWSVQPYSRSEAWKWAAEILTQLAGEAEKSGIALVLENINSQRADVVVSIDDLERMIAEVRSPGLQPMIDFYHLYLEGGDPIEAIERFGSRLAHVHLMDARLKDRSRQVPGEGELPLESIIHSLIKNGYDNWITVELWGSDPIAIGKRTMAFFKNLHLNE